MQKQFHSRRNRVFLDQTEQGRCVIKKFSEEASFQTELQVYRALHGSTVPCARVLKQQPGILVLSCLPGENLVQWLEQQEQTGVADWDIWEKLVCWLIAFWRHTGFVMTDVNLRNFLYDGQTKTLYGLDFEQCAQGSIDVCAATLAAFICSYRPEQTPLKQQIARYVLERFSALCQLDMSALQQETKKQAQIISQRRNNP